MAKPLEDWLKDEIEPLRDKSVKWLSEEYFHRLPMRSQKIDNTKFFTPADGCVIDRHESIDAAAPLVNCKGSKFSLQDLLDDDTMEGNYLVVGIFMTFYSVHSNVIPYTGNRTYTELPSIETFNQPMLEMEKSLLNGLIDNSSEEGYLFNNAREVSEIFAPQLGMTYNLVRVGDYDVNTFVNTFQPDGEEITPYLQNQWFGKITYGSQTLLIIKQDENLPFSFKLRNESEVGNYVKCKEDALVDIIFKE